MKCSTQKCAASSSTRSAPVIGCRYQLTTLRYMLDLEHGVQQQGDRAGKKKQSAKAHRERPEQAPLAALPQPEIEQGDADAVERVQDHGAQQRDLQQLENRMAEREQRRIECRRAARKLVDGADVKEEVNEQQHARDALQDVRRHAGGFHAFLNLRGKSMARLSHEMESVSVMPFGQTAVQLNCVWQRHSPARSWSRM